MWHCICAILLMQSVRDVLRQRAEVMPSRIYTMDAIRAGCAEAKLGTGSLKVAGETMQSVRDVLRQSGAVIASRFCLRMQSVRDVLRQSPVRRKRSSTGIDAIRAGCAEAKQNDLCLRKNLGDAIRAGCAEAKQSNVTVCSSNARCNPCGMFRKERKVIVFKRSCVEQ